MSTPARRVRQPGRTAQKNDPGNCGVCDKSIGNPAGTLALIISGTGSCCSLTLDADSAHAHQLTGTDGCVKGGLCSWEGTFTGGGLFIHMGLTLTCVAGVPTVSLSITRVDSSGNYIETLADGTYATTAYGTCDNCDCGQFINHASGTLTVYNTDVCNPLFCTSPQWSLGTSAVSPCPQPAAFNCCCGGTPPPPCFHVCIKDVADGCTPSGVDVRMCLSSTNPLTYTGTGSDAAGNTASGTLTYDPSTPSWTLTYSCNGGSPKTQTFTPSSGWGKVNGAINLSWEDGSGSSLIIGPSPQCPPIPACDCCKTSGVPTEFDVDLGAGGWTTTASGDPGSCERIKGTYTVTSIGGPSVGTCWTWLFFDPSYSGYCLGNDFQLSIEVDLLASPCRWRVTVFFHGTSNVGLTSASYESASFGSTDDCYTGGVISLTKTNEQYNSGDCAGTNVVCDGSLPGTITISAVI